MRSKLVYLALISVLVLSACNRGSDDATTTSVPERETTSTTSTSPETTEPEAESTTTTTVVVIEVPDYEVVYRSPTDLGDVLIVLLQQDGSALTSKQLEDLINDVVDEFSPREAHVIDSTAALPLVLLDPDDLTDEQLETLALHYLISLTENTNVTFVGPFEEIPGFHIGS